MLQSSQSCLALCEINEANHNIGSDSMSVKALGQSYSDSALRDANEHGLNECEVEIATEATRPAPQLSFTSLPPLEQRRQRVRIFFICFCLPKMRSCLDLGSRQLMLDNLRLAYFQTIVYELIDGRDVPSLFYPLLYRRQTLSFTYTRLFYKKPVCKQPSARQPKI